MTPDMRPSIVLVVVIAALVTVGVYLLLERSLSRVLVGLILVGNGANLLFLVAGGAAGGAPIVGTTPIGRMSDPLPQAMVLTAIVITLGLTAFLLAMAYRSWQLNEHDEVQDDLDQRLPIRKGVDRLHDLRRQGREEHTQVVGGLALPILGSHAGCSSCSAQRTPAGTRRGSATRTRVSFMRSVTVATEAKPSSSSRRSSGDSYVLTGDSTP